MLSACNNEAQRLGLCAGLSLADAKARYPALATAEADDPGDRENLRSLAYWCLRFSPLVAVEEPHGILLDITGCETLWKGEANLLKEITSRLRRHYSCQGAIAPSIGAAWALAQFAKADCIAPRTGLRDILRSLPIEALRVPVDQTESLRQLGFREVGDLYSVSRASLAARFGCLLIDRLQRALGEESEAMISLQPPPAFRVGLSFPEPIATAEDIHRAMHLLLPRLCQEMEERAQGVRKLVFSWYRVDGEWSSLSLGLAAPSVSPCHLGSLLREKISQVEPGLGIEQILLSAQQTEPLRKEQMDWQGQNQEGSLAELIDRLASRLGQENIYRLAPIESHIPERAVQKMPVLMPFSKKSPWAHPPQIRPLRLLPHPEPVEVLAPIPDDPPVQFKWRHKLHRVKRASGPERIEAEWWRKIEDEKDPTKVRDYYRVEEEGGHVFWLYRAGIYRGSEEAPRWYVHGFFS